MDGSICVNQVFRDTRSDRQFRLLWLDPVSSGTYIYWLDGKTSVPVMMPLAELEAGREKGWLVEDEDPYAVQVEASESDREYRDAIWARMKDALLDEPGIYDKKTRAMHLKRIEKESREKVPNLYKRLGRYWQRGKTPDAFLPCFSARGGKGKSRIGRANPPNGNGNEFGKTLTLEDHRNFEAAIRKYYLTKKEPDLASVYQRLLEDSYSVTIEGSEGQEARRFKPKGELPSLRQFRHWYSKTRNVRQEVTARKGETGYDLTARATTGKNEHGMMGPGSQYQVDATVGDIYLVSQFDRTDIIGRPVMYFVMDTVSRIVTGMYIGLEGPSWAGMMMALYNATTDKVDYCHQYGIEITEEMWQHAVTINGVQYIQVHPTFLYEGLWNCGVLVILILMRKKTKSPGELFMLYIALYGLGRFWIESLRTDQLLIPGTAIPVSMVVSAVGVIGAVIFIIYGRKRAKSVSGI